MSSEKPVSAPPGSTSSLADTDRDSQPPPPPPPGSSVQQQVTAGAGSGATGERMVSSAGSMVLPAGVINPPVPIRNIQMKFAVLVGLIQVGEVSNRDIVETVLNLTLDHLALLSTSGLRRPDFKPVGRLGELTGSPGNPSFAQCQPVLRCPRDPKLDERLKIMG
ncbi:Neurobeachin [Liparis tanakae]|uniref:Neurobeachin n=1 Tax=Liparis tanakae TaxID=230148 RepID=A0A4Z2GKI3_9TELE|nr:Neurobeachin [Liparis tanakae]